MNMQALDARRDVRGGYKVDVSRGSSVGRVSSEWFSRPDDERFLSLNELASSVRGRSERSRTRVVETALIHVEANRNDPERLALILPGADAPVQPTHWSFGQLASQVGAPAAYRIDSNGNLGLEVSVARRDTDVAFSARQGPAGAGTMEGQGRSRPLALCDNRITRLTISIVDIDQAKLVYRGFAEDVGCSEPSSNDLHILAAAAMKSLRPIN